MKTTYEIRLIADLKPNPRNARTHSEAQIAKIAASIREFGFINPVILDKDDGIIAGHGRIEGAKVAGMTEVPTIRADHLTKAQIQAYTLADNRLALDAGWNDEILKLEILELKAVGLDLSLTGFDKIELENLFKLPPVANGDVDAVPSIPATPVSILGDLWILGEHRLLCGDSTDSSAVARLLDGRKADMIFTDPPYNVNYGANNNPKYKSRTIKNDHMKPEAWDKFVTAYVQNLLNFCAGNIFIAMSDKELGHLQCKFEALGGHWSSFIVWVKNSLVISQKDYHSRKEQILYGWPGGLVGRYRPTDRSLDDIWEFDKPSRSDEHPTMKPVALVEKAINNGCDKGKVVADLFGGSGSTLIACHNTGRIGRLMELDPAYIDVIIKRWEGFTGLTAVHESGKSFKEITDERAKVAA